MTAEHCHGFLRMFCSKFDYIIPSPFTSPPPEQAANASTRLFTNNHMPRKTLVLVQADPCKHIHGKAHAHRATLVFLSLTFLCTSSLGSFSVPQQSLGVLYL